MPSRSGRTKLPRQREYTQAQANRSNRQPLLPATLLSPEHLPTPPGPLHQSTDYLAIHIARALEKHLAAHAGVIAKAQINLLNSIHESSSNPTCYMVLISTYVIEVATSRCTLTMETKLLMEASLVRQRPILRAWKAPTSPLS